MKSLILSFFAMILCVSCTSKNDSKSKVTFKLPEKRMSTTSQPMQSMTVGLWGVNPPSTIAEVDCYGITLQAPDLSEGKCYEAQASDGVLVSELHGHFAAGSEASIDVALGKARTFGVFAYKSANGICSDQLAGNFNPASYSPPLLVGSVTADIDMKEVHLTVPVSMTGSKLIERCEGKSYGSWPRTPVCTPTLASATYLGNGDLQLTGSCLDQTQSLDIRDVSTNTLTNTNVISKTASQLVVKLLSNLVVQKSKAYQMLITDARAQVVTSTIGLVVNDDFVLKMNGVTLGIYISGSPSNGAPRGGMSGSPILTEISGSLVAWGANDIGVTSIVSGVIMLDSSFSTLGYSDLRKLGISLSNSSHVQFTGTNCTGDVVIDMQAPNKVVRTKYISAPHDCTGAPTNCTDRFLKVNSPGSNQSNIEINSYSNHSMNGAGNTVSICTDVNYTVSHAYVIPATNMTVFTPGSGGEAPASISGLTVERP